MLDGFFYRQQKFWRAHGFSFLLLTIAVYFVYHGFSGKRGYFSYLETSRKLADAETELATLSAERKRLDTLVEGLAPHRINPDLLEGYLRQHGYIRDNEVILLPDN